MGLGPIQEPTSHSYHPGPCTKQELTSPSYHLDPDPKQELTSPLYHPGPGPKHELTSPSYHPGPRPKQVPTSPSYHLSPGPKQELISPSYHSHPSPKQEPTSPSYHPDPGPKQERTSPSSPFMPYPQAHASKSSPLKPVSPTPSLVPYPSKWIKAAYWPSSDSFPVSSIDTSYFTHIYHAFLLLDPSTYKLNVTQFDQIKIPQFIGTLHAKTPLVKTLLSIGGGASDPTVFSKMVSSDATRTIFIKSIIKVARNYGFDGVYLDWEFPVNDTDLFNLGLLYRQWHEALVNEALTCGKPRLLLTFAVYFASKYIFGEPQPYSYPIQAIRKYLDWVSPMCFDYHGKWDKLTGEHSAPYDPKSNISTYFGIGSWIQASVPSPKLVMGLPLYGKTWKLQGPEVNGTGAPAIGAGPGVDGVLDYYQILDFNYRNKTTIVFDTETMSYYSYVGDSWIGYDDVGSITMKVWFARSRKLGGYFFWALGRDKDWAITRQGKLVLK